MNRRDFSRLCAARLGFSGWPAWEGGVEDWNLGIITDQVDLDLGRVLREFYPKYHLRWAEIRNLKLGGQNRYVYTDATPKELRQIKRQLGEAGVKVSVLDTAIFKIALPGTVPVGEAPAYANPNGSEFEHQMEYLRRAAGAAQALGTERIRIFTFRRVADPAAVFDRIVEQLHRALEVARQEDITLLVENEYDVNSGTAAETAKLLKAIPDRRLMHNWDPCNAYELGEQPFPEAWDQLDHSRISHIHLKDAKGDQWKPIGAGDIDFAGQLKALKRIRYSGTLSVETRYKNARQDLYASSVESMDGLLRILKQI